MKTKTNMRKLEEFVVIYNETSSGNIERDIEFDPEEILNEIDIDLKKEDLPELQNEFENFGDDYTYSEMISIREWITDKMNKLEVPQ